MDTLRGVLLGKSEKDLVELLGSGINLVNNAHLKSFLSIISSTIAEESGCLWVQLILDHGTQSRSETYADVDF